MTDPGASPRTQPVQLPVPAAGSWLVPVRGSRGWGISAVIDGVAIDQPRPIAVELFDGRVRRRSTGYNSVASLPDGVEGRASVRLAGDAMLLVTDTWSLSGELMRVRRRAIVDGTAAGTAFLTSLRVRLDGHATWRDVEPFAPGLTYGDAEEVPEWSIGSARSRRRGLRWVLAREDRLAAPTFGVRRSDGRWIAVRHQEPSAQTIAADGEDVRGGILVDGRLGTASLGGVARAGRIELGIWYPGTEGEVTYESGGLPLRQRRGWRRRYHPVEPGVSHDYSIEVRVGRSRDPVAFWREVWRATWRALAPTTSVLDADQVVRDAARVLRDQVISGPGVSGVPLEVDATTGRPMGERLVAIMGFVGANTDVGELLIRVGRSLDGAEGEAMRAAGRSVLDAFARLPINPPAGEGFDLRTGTPVTYRRIEGVPAVFARSLAEGCRAAFDAWHAEADVGAAPPSAWRTWALDGAAWLLAAQRPDGGVPRAWAARSGRVLQPSTSATASVVPFLVRVARVTADDRVLEAALRAGDHTWVRAGGRRGGFAGATLDNPDVVDKEASALALEAFLALHAATGDPHWLERADVAASVAETWIYAWDIPMPVDCDDAALGWKRGAPTTGLQLITSGVSMADGFLAANAAAFARLAELTGDDHWLDVSRVVTWGPKAMLAIPGRTFDLAGPGWMQEHWSLATRRGQGLNRAWLPWVAVATIRGILRLRDEVPGSAWKVLGDSRRHSRPMDAALT
jgi:hypothetical protein